MSTKVYIFAICLILSPPMAAQAGDPYFDDEKEVPSDQSVPDSATKVTSTSAAVPAETPQPINPFVVNTLKPISGSDQQSPALVGASLPAIEPAPVQAAPSLTLAPPLQLVPTPPAPKPELSKPLSPKAEQPFEEKGPLSLQAYIDSGQDPRFIRINIKNYNVRKTPDFSEQRTDNIDFKIKGGDLLKVVPSKIGDKSIRPLIYGTAVRIYVGKDIRWVYVPHKRQESFQFCRSEVCTGALSQALDILQNNTGGTMQEPHSCEVSSDPVGLVLPPGAAQHSVEPDIAASLKIPKPEKAPEEKKPVPARSPSAFGLKLTPWWEIKKGAAGKAWTRNALEAIDKYGKGLLKTRNLRDAYAFCPNYSNLDEQQRKEFWVHMLSAVSYAESSYAVGPPIYDERRHSQFMHGAMSEWGFQHYSMGPFALTYKYSRMSGYQTFCGGFSSRKDSGKDVSDLSLTIYDLKNQMECATGIMNSFVEKHGAVGYNGTAARGPAWSTLMGYNGAGVHKTIKVLRRYTPCVSSRGGR